MSQDQKETKQGITWHALEVPTIFERLSSRQSGLSEQEALKRLREDGLNKLPDKKTDGVLKTFIRQFKSPLIYVLLAAGIVVITLSKISDGVIIFFVLFVNALIGTFQEGRARETMKALKDFVKGKASVIRGAAEREISDEELVLGDVITLRDGDKIPADARLVSTLGLQVNESVLTGESEPVIKDLKIYKEEIPPPERKNMIYKGTLCVSGEARAVVVATGSNTFVGQISSRLSEIDAEMPLKKKIRSLSKMIGFGILLAIIFISLPAYFQGVPPKEIFFTATAVAVSLIPEGLPVVITLILARGVHRMAKRNALIKNMQAVEALGQANIVALDKTGTLTKNELMIEKVYVDRKVFTVLGSGFEREGDILFGGKTINPVNHPELTFAGKVATFCANAVLEEVKGEIKVLGDPTEAALLVFGEKAGFKKNELESEEPKIVDVPFNFKNKFHITLHRSSQGYLLTAVGAPEAILSKVSHLWSNGAEKVLTHEDRKAIERKIEEFSISGLRVLAFAYHKSLDSSLEVENLPRLSFGGLFGMADVLREGVAESIALIKENGIKPVMITGDFMITAEAIAKLSGIWSGGDRTIVGREIESLSSEDLSKKLGRVSVFGRVLPEHKLSIIEAYKLRGDVIGMTGDGVNDALSLQAAHLGIAMGKGGTDVAREAADIVLLDNNLESIVAAIEEGRSIYATIKKTVLYLISTGIGEFLSIAAAIFIGLPLPLFPSQILWLNLVTDGFLVVGLAFEPNVSLGESERGVNIIGKKAALRAVLMGLTMMVGALLIFGHQYGIQSPKAWTMSLTVLAVFQWFNAWNVRSPKKSVFDKPFSNKYLLLGLLGALFLHIMAVYHPFMQELLHTVPLSLNDWLLISAVASSIIAVEEIRKVFARTLAKRK